MRLNTLALLISAAAISAAPVPKLRATLRAISGPAREPDPIALKPPTDSLAVLNIVDALTDTLRSALPAEFAKQLTTALGPTLGPVETIPMVGAILASLLGDDSDKGNWNPKEIDGIYVQVAGRLASVHARPTSLAPAAP